MEREKKIIKHQKPLLAGRGEKKEKADGGKKERFEFRIPGRKLLRIGGGTNFGIIKPLLLYI